MQDSPRWLGITTTAWIALLMAAIASGACYAACGATLGLFFGGVVFAAILLPPLALTENRLLDRLIIAACVNDGVGAVWLIAIFTSAITLVQWLLCYAILIAICLALLGIVMLIDTLRFLHLARREYTPGGPPCIHGGLNGDSMRCSPIPAAAVTITLALAWLTIPIWSSHLYWNWFVSVHPLFALNGVLKNLGIWTQAPLAYRYLLNLGQDVPYELPASIWPMMAAHAGIGAVSLLIGRVVGKR